MAQKAPLLALGVTVTALFAPPFFGDGEALAQSGKKRGLVASLLGAGVAAGARAAGASGKETKVYTANHLSQNALKACLTRAHQLDVGDAENDAVVARLKRESAELDREDAALDRDGKETFTEQSDVDRYNSRVRAHNANLKAYNAKVDAQKEQAAAQNRNINAFNRDCAGKRYFDSDLAAIRGQLPFDVSKFSEK